MGYSGACRQAVAASFQTFPVGEDAFAGLERWKEWQRLLDYAHLVVLTRPGDTPAPRGAPPLARCQADCAHVQLYCGM